MCNRERSPRPALVGVIVCGLGLLLLGSSVGGCGRTTESKQNGDDTTMTARPIKTVLEAHTDSLMAVPGVQGVGQGQCDGEPCIRIYASEMTPEIKSEVPDLIEGYAVEVEVTGQIRPRSVQ